MDRFKFRAWHKESEQYYYFNLFDLKKHSLDDFEEEDIEQGTGLKDKNGKLIYEGDMVKSPHSYKYEVKWSDGNWGLFFGNGQYDICLCEKASKEVEVIGNIHENADLLGEE